MGDTPGSAWPARLAESVSSGLVSEVERDQRRRYQPLASTHVNAWYTTQTHGFKKKLSASCHSSQKLRDTFA